MFLDKSLELIDPSCEFLTTETCPSTCSGVLNDLSEKWGCCLFTYGVVTNNLTYIEGVAEVCNLKNVEFCIGGISGDEVTSESGFLAFSSVLLLGLAQLLALLL